MKSIGMLRKRTKKSKGLGEASLSLAIARQGEPKLGKPRMNYQTRKKKQKLRKQYWRMLMRRKRTRSPAGRSWARIL